MYTKQKRIKDIEHARLRDMTFSNNTGYALSKIDDWIRH